MELNTRQKQLLNVGIGVGVLGVGLWALNKFVINRGSGDQETPSAEPEKQDGSAAGSGAAQKAAVAVNIATSWAPDAILSYGSKRKKMVAQLQHVINAIARLRKEPQITADGAWGKKTQEKVERYFGKNQVTYNRARSYAAQLYDQKGLTYPDGKPKQFIPGISPGTILPPGSTIKPGTQWVPDFPTQGSQPVDGYGWKF